MSLRSTGFHTPPGNEQTKKTDGDVNLRNVQSGSTLSMYIVGVWGSFNSCISFFDTSQIFFCFKSHLQEQKYQNDTLHTRGHYKKQGSNKYDNYENLLLKFFQKRK